MRRCHACWNLVSVCTCPAQGPPHPMFECECCHRRNVPAKMPGIGYVCEECFTEENGY